MRYRSISPRLFKENRNKLLSELDADSVVILHSSDQMVRNGDQYYTYRQSSDFFYLTGIEQEMSILLLSPDQKVRSNTAKLFIRKPDPNLETWEGPKLTREEAGRISGIDSVHWLEDFDSLSRECILTSTSIYCSTREQPKFKPEVPSRDERYLIRLKKKYPSHQFKRLTPLLSQLRSVKEPEELDMIREAIRITSLGFLEVLAMMKAGLKEYEIEAVLTREFIRHGANGHAYAPIIATGKNACYLHYIQNDHTLHSGQLVLMDFGAEYGNYAADCSRTLPVDGKFSARQLEIYNACLDLYDFARSIIKPGISIEKINEQVWKRSEEVHISLGLYTHKDVEKQDKESPMYRKYLMHGISHFIGLDVHDVGQIKSPLTEGMVLTCEPGIYIPEEETGVRLENNLLVTAGGNTDLMAEIPLTPNEIEAFMASR